MAFDIRAIFSRSLGGRPDQTDPVSPGPEPDESPDDDDGDARSPIIAAGTAAAAPDTVDMAQGGSTTSTLLIPEGLAALPSAAVDTAAARDDEAVDSDQAAAVAEVAVAAALVGDHLGDDERDDLLESLREVPGLDAFDEEALDAIVDRLDERSGADLAMRMEAQLDELAGVLTDPVLRRAAFQLAVYFCAWDGSLSDDEFDYLGAVAEAFEIPEWEARQLRESTLIEAGEEGEQRAALDSRS
jgi:tellurite resistance protein